MFGPHPCRPLALFNLQNRRTVRVTALFYGLMVELVIESA